MPKSPDPESKQRSQELPQSINTAIERGDPNEYEPLLLQFMTLLAEHAEGPTAEEIAADKALEQAELEANWDEVIHLKLQRVERAVQEENWGEEFAVRRSLAEFYHLTGKNGAALEQARAACDVTVHQQCETLEANARGLVAECLLQLGRMDEAMEQTTRMLALCKEGNGAWEILRGRALLLRAECHLDRGEQDLARANLDAAGPTFEKGRDTMLMAGLVSRLAMFWSLTARLGSLGGDRSGAIEAWRNAVKFRRHLSSMPHLAGPCTSDELAQALNELSLACDAAGQAAAAGQARAESRKLRSRLALPPLDDLAE